MVQIGDLVQKTATFSQTGVVIEKKGDGSVIVDSSPDTVNQYHRYVDTTGLTESEKIKFNDILDDIHENSSSQELLQDLQDTIDELIKDPESQAIVKYLKKEQNILSRSLRVFPRFFTLPGST